jgi:hypothetical protein
MGASLIGVIFGALAGALTGTEFGVWSGAVVGLSIGFSIWAFSWLRDHFGEAPTVEQHRVICDRYGQPADIEFVGDLHTGRWYDVKSCSLLEVPTEVVCHKGCVAMMKAGHVQPGRACGCHMMPDRLAA